jgi:DNA polymerase beta
VKRGIYEEKIEVETWKGERHTMDYKPVIIDALRVLEARDRADKKPFSVRAYATVLRHLEAHPAPIRSLAEIPVFQGVGEKIKKKMEEIVETGRLEAAEKAKADYPLEALALFGGIYGIGPVKARELVEMGLRTLTDLRIELHMRPDLLHEKQKAGLFYYEDLVERIPREEMREHEMYLQGVITQVLGQDVSMTIVGSYRRGAETSGDIDVIIRIPSSDGQSPLERGVGTECLHGASSLERLARALETAGYMEYVLALGEKKCMGIARLPAQNKARRVDFLITPEHEYACALLYFTGSDMFNVAFRQHALQKGYTLNEHTMTPIGDAPAPPPFHTEQDIFRFLSLQYVEPSKRVEGAISGDASVPTPLSLGISKRVLIKRPKVVYP